MRYLSVRSFAKHQHYKDRRPPWIKLHVEVLDDYAFTCLQDASKAHLMLLWVLASKMDNRIPFDLAFLARKLGTTSPIDVEELVAQGFIEVSPDDSAPLAPRKQSAMPETEAVTETQEQSETKAPRKAVRSEEAFNAAWAIYPRRAGGNTRADALKAWNARVASGENEAEMHAGTVRYKAYCEATGKVGTEYVKQGSTFYGPSGHWREAWEIPPPVVAATNGKHRPSAADAMSASMQRIFTSVE